MFWIAFLQLTHSLPANMSLRHSSLYRKSGNAFPLRGMPKAVSSQAPKPLRLAPLDCSCRLASASSDEYLQLA